MNTIPIPGSVAVIGGGIAGLVAAVQAATAGPGPVTLFDTGSGRARTTEHDGVLLNEGPHALYLHGALAQTLRGWGIDPPGGSPDQNDTWAVDGDRATRFPSSARGLAATRLLGARSKLAFAKLQLQLSKLDPGPLHGRSVSSWLADESPELRRVLLTLIRLTSYVNAPDLMDAGAAVAQMQIAVAGGVRYVDGGWATITGALHERFRDLGGRVIAGRQVTAVQPSATGVSIRTDDSIQDAAAAVLGVGGPSTAARLLGIDLPASWDVPPVQASCLDIWTTARPTGSLTFDLDRDLYLSVHAPVAQIAPVGVSVVSVLHYLPVGEGPSKPAEEKAALLAHAARAGIAEAAILGQRYLHRMTVAHGFPQAEHRGVGPSVEVPGHPRVFVAGDWVDADALLSDASAASAIEAAGAAVVAAGQPVGATRG